MLTGGPHLSGRFRGESLGACSDCRRFWAEYRAGTIDEDAMCELEDGINRSDGHCTVMGTASTMAAMAEALGMALPGTAAIPAPDARRLRLAEAAGRQIVATVRSGIRPSDILTPRAFENAIRLMMALGGSTNAVIHLTAIAGRRGIPLPLELFDRISRETPFITNLRPSGQFHMEQLFEAGGVPAVMKELARGGLLHLDERTITGQTLGEQLETRARHWATTPPAAPAGAAPSGSSFRWSSRSAPQGGIAMLRGNLAPRGRGGQADGRVAGAAASTAVRRWCSARPRDLAARIDDPSLDVTPDSVLVLQNAGPRGAPGMPEAGGLPIPKKLLATGVRDMLRISDARMSGTGLRRGRPARRAGSRRRRSAGPGPDRRLDRRRTSRCATPPPGGRRRRARPPPRGLAAPGQSAPGTRLHATVRRPRPPGGPGRRLRFPGRRRLT